MASNTTKSTWSDNTYPRIYLSVPFQQSASHGRFLAYNVLGLKRNTKAAFLAQIYVGFAVTAIIHVAGDYSLLGSWSRSRSLRFFLLQAVGITVEMMVLDTAKRLSIHGRWRYVGYVWVILWFTYTVPDWTDPLLRAGLSEASSNFGIIDRVLEWVHL